MRQQVPMVFLLLCLSRCCCLHFCRNKFGLLLAQGYSKGQMSRIIHKLQLFMTLCDQRVVTTSYYSMRHQVLMVFLLLLVYLCVVACISEERKLGSMLGQGYFKGQRLKALFKKCNFLWVEAINMHLFCGHYMMCWQVSMSFCTYFTLITLLAFMLK